MMDLGFFYSIING